MDIPEDLKQGLNKHGLTKLQTIGPCTIGSLHTFFSDRHKQSVLLKIIPLTTPVPHDDLTKLAEARSKLAALSHPTLPKLLDALVFEKIGAFVLIFEDFRQEETVPLLEAEAGEKKKISWMAQLVEAFDYLHKSDIILNCAPADLYFVDNNKVYLADFGLGEHDLLPCVSLHDRLS